LETARCADSVGMMTCRSCISSDRMRSIGGRQPPPPLGMAGDASSSSPAGDSGARRSVSRRAEQGGEEDETGGVLSTMWYYAETWLGWEEEDVPGPDVRGVCVVILLFRETRCVL
jgi:hypothetical protein